MDVNFVEGSPARGSWANIALMGPMPEQTVSTKMFDPSAPENAIQWGSGCPEMHKAPQECLSGLYTQFDER